MDSDMIEFDFEVILKHSLKWFTETGPAPAVCLFSVDNQKLTTHNIFIIAMPMA